MVDDRYTAKVLQQFEVSHATEEVGCTYRGIDGFLVAGVFICLFQQDVVLADVVVVVPPVSAVLWSRTAAIGTETCDVGTAVPLIVVPTTHQVNKVVGSLLELGCILECDGFGSAG